MSEYSEQAVAVGFKAMCYDPRRFERMKQNQESKELEDVEKIVEEGIEKEKPHDLTDGEELFNIDIASEARGIHVKIQCEDSGDAVFMAGFVISAFRKLGVEAKSKVMP